MASRHNAADRQSASVRETLRGGGVAHIAHGIIRVRSATAAIGGVSVVAERNACGVQLGTGGQYCWRCTTCIW